MQQSSPPAKPPRWLTAARFWDLLAVAVIAFVAWKLLLAPRSLPRSAARPAPHVVLESLTGQPFALAQHRGRIVFLDFYATWCAPCRVSLPLVEGFARAHPEVDVVPVDVGERPAIVAEFARRYQLRNVALDRDQLAATWFGVVGFPTMVVIDPRNRVRATWPGVNPAIGLAMGNAESQLRRD